QRRRQLRVEQARRGRCGGEDQGQGGKAVAVHGNLSDAKAAKSVVAEAVKALGPIDILVNNAGVYEFAPLEAITPEHFHKH
ncbi:SDR family NAD(P)-dependent oxidoreductase, partial [Vibrio parahaemolyticus]